MTASFDVWEARTQLALATRNINHHVAAPLLADARRHWEATGGTPDDALGSPSEFASDAAALQPARSTAALDRSGTTPAGHLTAALFQLAVLVVPWSLGAAVVAGSAGFTVTPARLVVGVLFVVVFVSVFGVPQSLRAAGRPHLVSWFALPALLLMGLTVWAGSALPRTALLEIPVLVVVAVAAIVAYLFVRDGHPAPTGEEDRSSGGADPRDTDRWMARLHGLLVGRHDLPPDRAAALVEEARAHLGAAAPAAEFGPLQIYAAELAAAVPVRRRDRTVLPRRVLFVVFCLLLARDDLASRFSDGTIWRAVILLAVILAVTAGLLVMAARWCARHRGDPDTSTAS